MVGSLDRHGLAQPALALAHLVSPAVPFRWAAVVLHELQLERELPQSSECLLVRAGRPCRNDKRDGKEKRGCNSRGVTTPISTFRNAKLFGQGAWIHGVCDRDIRIDYPGANQTLNL